VLVLLFQSREFSKSGFCSIKADPKGTKLRVCVGCSAILPIISDLKFEKCNIKGGLLGRISNNFEYFRTL
jgi:hypothetical protein